MTVDLSPEEMDALVEAIALSVQRDSALPGARTTALIKLAGARGAARNADDYRFDLAVAVTPEDIRDGVRQDCRACPLAIAGTRALVSAGRMPAGHVLVALPFDLRLIDNRDGHIEKLGPSIDRIVARWDLPLSATRFLSAFDHATEDMIRPIAFVARYASTNDDASA